MTDYNPREIEPKWQEKWQKDELYKTPDEVEGRENEYVLVEFAYPSGNLHAGHWYAFSVPDIYARYKRMTGKNVMYPFGFDAFGLPAENAAIKDGINPRIRTFDNIEYMKGQLRSMGTSFDWSREVITASPDYYRWTQSLFLKFLDKDLAYRKETPANWCPKDKTVLANEQVIDGKCERCGTNIEKRDMLQWNLKITDYADRLIDDLEPLDWPNAIKEAQKNWIGRSEGSEINFELKFIRNPEVNDNRGPNGEKAAVKVFTTRPDTLFGATYVVLAPEHLWIKLATDDNHDVISNKEEVKKYIDEVRNKSEIERTGNKEKTGIKIEGVVAINPATKEEIPIWVADYVLPNYGTGAIMAVPAHDERDFEFAQKYNLPIKQVIAPVFVDKVNPPKDDAEDTIRHGVIVLVKHWSEDKYLLNYSPKFNWKCLFTGGIEEGEDPLESAVREIQEETGYQNIKSVRYIPLEHVDKFHAPHKGVNRIAYQKNIYIELADGETKERTEEEKDLHHLSWLTADEMRKTITLPNHLYIFDTELAGGMAITGEGVLMNSGTFDGMSVEEAKKAITEFVGGELVTTFKLRDWGVSRQRYWGCPIPVIHCESCGIVPVPESSLPVVLPEIEDYMPNDDGQSPLAKATEWVNVPCPKCGKDAKRDTDTLDTFVDSSWYFLRYADPNNKEEFASKEKLALWMPVDFYSGGAEHTTMHLLYSRFFHKVLFDLGLVNESEPYKRRMNRGLILGPDGHKMSKSKGNVIDPDDYVKRLGADTVRMYLAFIGPYNEVGFYPWSPDSIVGVRRFLERVWNMKNKLGTGNLDEVTLNRAVRDVGESVDKMKMNTAVPVLMSFINAADKSGLTLEQYGVFLKLLAPFAPHMADELWSQLGHTNSIHTESWPSFDPEKLESADFTLGVQVNGKVRASITSNNEESEESVKSRVLSLPEVKRWLEGKEPKKVIVVKGKIVNVVC